MRCCAEKALHKSDIETVILVNLRRIPLAKAVGADTLIAKVIAYNGKLLLNRPFGQRKNAVVARDAVSQAIGCFTSHSKKG